MGSAKVNWAAEPSALPSAPPAPAASAPAPPSAPAPAPAPVEVGPRDQSAQPAPPSPSPSPASRHSAPPDRERDGALEIIGQARAQEVIRDLVDLLEVDEVIQASGEAARACDPPEVVGRAVRRGEPGVVDHEAPAVVEGAHPLPVLEVEPVGRVVPNLKVAAE